jgi:dephospho-CoA kinase
VDAPLLVETGPTDLADVVILVTAPEAVRKERIMRRNNLSEEETGQRIASQIPDEKQRRWADYVIINENDLDDLENQAMALWSRIVKRKESG